MIPDGKGADKDLVGLYAGKSQGFGLVSLIIYKTHASETKGH